MHYAVTDMILLLRTLLDATILTWVLSAADVGGCLLLIELCTKQIRQDNSIHHKINIHHQNNNETI